MDVVLVHGAWHGSWAWQRLLPELERAGLTPHTVDLPSAGGDADLATDAGLLYGTLQLIDGPVVVVGHSYGGMVITEAASRVPNVRALVYLCAFQLDVGESLLAALGHRLPPWIEVDESTDRMTVTDPVKRFYGDVDAELAQDCAGRLTTQSRKSFADPLTRASWRDIASTYLLCTQDRAIAPDAQRTMSGRSQTVHTLDSSHSPFLSQPSAVADIIVGAARSGD